MTPEVIDLSEEATTQETATEETAGPSTTGPAADGAFWRDVRLADFIFGDRLGARRDGGEGFQVMDTLD